MLAVCVSCAWVDSCRDLAGLLQETNFLCLPSVKPHLLDDVQKMVTTLPKSNSKKLAVPTMNLFHYLIFWSTDSYIMQ